MIYGTDYDTPDGTCIRDYVHVADLADAHVLALHALERRGGFASYNLGTGHGFSVREVIRAAQKITGCPIVVEESARRPGDPPRLVADACRAKLALGWEPRQADLGQVIATAWEWMAKRHLETAMGQAM
jgi:UDP-glucose 4-epimerase